MVIHCGAQVRTVLSVEDSYVTFITTHFYKLTCLEERRRIRVDNTRVSIKIIK